jgi:hypothetical protein
LANQIIRIPVSEVDALITGGQYRLRYRIKSKDGTQVSQWSPIKTVSFPSDTSPSGIRSSFYELYMGTGRPSLSESGGSGANPHPTSPYIVSFVSQNLSSNYIPSFVNTYGMDNGFYSYTWATLPTDLGILYKYDVYVSKKNLANTSWGNWEYLGTAKDANQFNFQVEPQTTQAIQVALFLSSSPGINDVHDLDAAVTFVSISPEYSTYYDGGGTLGTVSGTGPYTATITGLANVPATSAIKDRPIFADAGSGSLGTGKAKVASTSGGNSIKVTSDAAMTAGTLTNIRL